jgi:benzoyl-CoA-dihydrodiol lyase
LEPPIATLTLCVSPDHGLRDDYELKLNSYDLSVDIELHDAVQRLRFEHPEVGAVVITGGLEKVFCAGANIQMLAGASHVHKVNFCKFTNETRNSIEDATSRSAQTWIAAVNGTAAGGGYELALACDEIVLVDDRASAVSLPELPLLGVLPGTGGLTRVVDKRLVRRDRADVFATKSEGIKGQQAVEWGLVDVLAPPSKFADVVRARALARAATSTRPGGPGVLLTPLARTQSADGLAYDYLTVTIDRPLGAATFTLTGPKDPQPTYPDELLATGAAAWIIAAARQLDDAILRMRFNEPEIGTWVLRTEGEIDAVLAADALLEHHADHWLVNEVRLLWRRTLSRLDLSARSLVALVEAGSCFAGTLAELVLAADRSYMLDDPAGSLNLSAANDGWYPMVNGLSRLQTRFWGRDANLDAVRADLGKALDARAAVERGLVTFTPDDLDWDEEVRVALEERASFSPDALTAMEANLRFVGPETMESRIFARLSAWQNWVFQRPNAAGPDGALKRYGTGARPVFDKART